MNRPLVSVLLAAGVGLALTQTASAAMHATKEFEAGDLSDFHETAAPASFAHGAHAPDTRDPR